MFRFLASIVLYWVLAGSQSAWASAQWEAAIVFLGAEEPEAYQADVDRNFSELAKLSPNENLRLTVYRELPDQSVTWQPGRDLPREEERSPREKALLQAPERLEGFLHRAFQNPEARRLLVIYGHGLGFDGLKGVSLKTLRARLEGSLPSRGDDKPLDILWLDACFMATVEVAHELRKTTHLVLASEDAEFSAGLPFDRLEMLNAGPEDAREVATDLAERFVESYSFSRNGSQTSAIYSSSATISVIDPEKLAPVIHRLGLIAEKIGRFTDRQRESLRRSARHRNTQNSGLVDLGSLLVRMTKLKDLPAETKEELFTTLDLLELGEPERRARLKTNARLRIPVPSISRSGQKPLLVYGFENWTRGFRGDQETLEKLPPRFVPDTFVRDAAGLSRSWPAIEVATKTIIISPFTAGINRFDYFFADPVTREPLTKPQSYTRSQDFMVFSAESPENPILFTAYTQGIGISAERYTGLAILDPSLGEASVDYMDLDFAAIGWAAL